ncbi:F0F1 ATP synthase subunit A [Gordonia sp. (in: high G+C Gram-positive bacteria)]|jgi:F-type H+-transporting ATPase subunit a|uniref:F0F1 ATP synthase subunit A n=2 Tax=Gordonia sp. (in: high G+C Gram-positive bacteria) TaxID=84139 RepID=UPI002610FBB3|nr:F0F1 ATP synthase subunit A [Gordonia sp. (in: high G+C Gram-positive bacteria)]HMS76848.1 F0F1 ATP synthase subunit A [Gordonia sp. (in: high G+C Gram-positive bacteria)]HQV18349.1 F0F1 ATP synthase subunit A [Gordonia sp. (in: high G+C Gram-positive bacteria)]
MSETSTLAASIEVGHHKEAEFLGMTFNVDTIMASALAAVIVIGLAFVLKAKVTSGKPNTVQIYFETITVQMRQQIEQGIGMKIAGFVLPLAVTLFTYILIANWIGVIPWQYGSTNDEGESVAHEVLMTPSGDVNFVYAMALFVFVWYHAAGVKRRGIIGHPVKLVKGHAIGLAPINIIEEIAKPVSLSLRLFGNMFAGGTMLAVIAMFPAYILWAPNALWKSFDLFVGLIQAFIFSLLTVLYFSQAMETEDHH